LFVGLASSHDNKEAKEIVKIVKFNFYNVCAPAIYSSPWQKKTDKKTTNISLIHVFLK